MLAQPSQFGNQAPASISVKCGYRAMEMAQQGPGDLDQILKARIEMELTDPTKLSSNVTHVLWHAHTPQHTYTNIHTHQHKPPKQNVGLFFVCLFPWVFANKHSHVCTCKV